MGARVSRAEASAAADGRGARACARGGAAGTRRRPLVRRQRQHLLQRVPVGRARRLPADPKSAVAKVAPATLAGAAACDRVGWLLL